MSAKSVEAKLFAPARSEPDSVVKSATTHQAQTIKSFLTREIQVYAGSFSNQARGAIITTLTLPDILLSTAMITDKLAGSQAIRGSIRIRMVVAGTPYHQGCLRTTWVPCAALTTMGRAYKAHINAGGSSTQATMMQVSYLPGSYVNIATDHEVIDEIPYLMPQAYYDLSGTGAPQNMAYWALYVEDALQYAAGSSTSIPIVIYASWGEDVEVLNPTYTSSYGIAQRHGVVHQMDIGRAAEGFAMNARMAAAGSGKVVPVVPSAASTSEKEARISVLEKGGAVSAGNLLVRIANWTGLSEWIPKIPEIIQNVAWAVKIVEVAAMAFGFSKPTANLTYTSQCITARFGATCDGQDFFSPLGATSGNELAMYPLGGTQVDEMSFDRVLTVFANISSFTFSNQAAGTALYTEQCIPNSFGISQTDSSLTTYRVAPMVTYTSYFFNQCRGALRFRFRAYKTQMHEGSLFVVFFPGFVVGTPTLAQSQFANRILWDLSAGETIVVETPYTSQNNYQYPSDTFGTLVIYVNGVLTYPNTVATSIDIMVDVACAPGFEFAGPSDANPISPYSTQGVGEAKSQSPASPSLPEFAVEPKSPAGAVLTLTKTASTQVFHQMDTNLAISRPLAGSRQPMELENAKLCIGERILSIRQLLKRLTPEYVPLLTGQTVYFVRPDTIGYCSQSGGITQIIYDMSFSPFSAFAACYVFKRGSMRAFCVNNSSAVPRYGISFRGGAAPISAYTNPTNVAVPLLFQGVTQNGEVLNTVAIPSYQMLPFTLCRWGSSGNNEPNDYLSSQSRLVISDTTTNQWSFLRAIGEDFSLGFFIGPPRYVLNTDM